MLRKLIYFNFVYLWFVLADDCAFYGDTSSTSESLLKRLSALRGHVFSAKQTGPTEVTFDFSLCTNPHPSSCRENSSVVAIEDGKCTTIGSYNETEIAGGENWVMVTFYGGDNFTDTFCDSVKSHSIITIVCDSSRKQNDLQVLHLPMKNHPCYYSFLLSSEAVCEKHLESAGLSGGSVFCIMFFTFVGVYLTFGFCYRRFVIRAKGLEQIPNYDFWREFGNLQADGCDFVCRCGRRQEAKMYQGIGDDTLGTSSQRDAGDHDDRLLPM